MIKQLKDSYRGWGGVDKHGKEYGFQGYPEKTANEIAETLRETHRTKGPFTEIDVTIEKMPNGNFAVIDHSKYKSWL